MPHGALQIAPQSEGVAGRQSGRARGTTVVLLSCSIFCDYTRITGRPRIDSGKLGRTGEPPLQRGLYRHE